MMGRKNKKLGMVLLFVGICLIMWGANMARENQNDTAAGTHQSASR